MHANNTKLKETVLQSELKNKTKQNKTYKLKRSITAKMSNNYRLMNEAEYFMKNYGDRGRCYPSRPQAKADNTLRDLHNLHTIRKPNSIIVLLFTQNNLLFLLCFQPLFRLVPAVVGCVQFLLLKRVKCPPFQFLQRKQLNLVPMSFRLTVH